MKFYSSSKLLHCALVLALLAAAPACKKLDLDPTDTIDPDKAFRNVADLNHVRRYLDGVRGGGWS